MCQPVSGLVIVSSAVKRWAACRLKCLRTTPRVCFNSVPRPCDLAAPARGNYILLLSGTSLPADGIHCKVFKPSVGGCLGSVRGISRNTPSTNAALTDARPIMTTADQPSSELPVLVIGAGKAFA